MRPLTEEQQANLPRTIAEDYRGAALEERDVEMLADILHTEPMLKALGRIRGAADQAAFNLVNANLGDEKERHAASRLQGVVHGSIGVIDTIIGLASLPEDMDDDSPASTDS